MTSKKEIDYVRRINYMIDDLSLHEFLNYVAKVCRYRATRLVFENQKDMKEEVTKEIDNYTNASRVLSEFISEKDTLIDPEDTGLGCVVQFADE